MSTADPLSELFLYNIFVAVCSNNVQEIENGFIAFRKYIPPSVTYKCNSGFFDVGDKNTTQCVPGKDWEVPDYKCTQGMNYTR